MIGETIAHFIVTAKIGEGGMGEVYRATDTKLGREVALKILPAAFASDSGRMARFEREAKLLASLNHPHIAQIYGVEERALVMELVEGESPKGPLPFEDAWKIASQIASALEYAHEKGIVHRDLKPANIKITPDGIVKLLDFGLAKAFTAQKESSANVEQSPTLTIGATEVGVILGTAAYMAPEQAKGKSVDKRADIWAFGVVLYELLTGDRLFKGQDVADTLAQVLTNAPQLDRVPAEARKLLRRCLEKDSKQRLRDIGDAVALLDAGLVTVESPRHRSMFWPATAGLLLIALGGLAALRFRERQVAHPQMIRFQIPFPEKMTPSPRSVPALSPDGRLLAFLADDANGTGRVWIHALDSVESRPISGTEGAFGSPFWSANGDYVVFGVSKRSPGGGGVLKKAAVAGGPPQTICEIQTYLRGGFWTPDGKIVFATVLGGIFEVAATGRSPILIKRPSEGNLGNPRLLPDGRHFLFDVGGFWTPRSQGIYLSSIDSTPERQNDRRLLPDQSNAAYVPSDDPNFGYVLFVRDESLMAQRFDTKRLELSGEPAPIAERVGEAWPDQFGLFSAAGNAALIYRQSG